MAESATVANAYVQIIPSAKGIKENVTDVLADAGAQGGEGAERGFLAGLGNLGSKLAPIAAAAGAALAAGVAAITKAAVDSYADFEQLAGGIETLYGDSADIVMQNAQRAFEAAGMSANGYMETVMQFSGALLQSVGGDTVEAARMADMAITDMADNANKMGTDIERLQDAYRGFSRGNFTMLDNLSLGYGGTRAEMQRLLADAEAISGVHYDIENYADVVDAIHVIQDEMGITGTTAEEAASTISGSWGMLSASWDNLLVSLAGGGDDIGTAVQNVFESLLTWLGNLVPRILQTVQGIFEAIPAIVEEALPAVHDAVMSFVEDTFGSDAAERLDGFIGGIQEVFAGLSEHFGEFSAVITDSVWPALQNLFEAAQPLIDAVFPVLMDVVQTLGDVFIDVGTIIAEFIAGAINVISSILPIVTDIFNSVKSAIEGPINTAKEIVGNAIEAIKGFFSFEFHWPHIPLPHFSISGSLNPIDWVTNGGLPHISVDWYAKGGFFTGPTIMAVGMGEQGTELAWPSYEPYFSKYAEAIASHMGGGGPTVYVGATAINDDAMIRQAYEQLVLRSYRRAGRL